MKTINHLSRSLLFLTFVMTVFFGKVQAQAPDAVFEQITAALTKGDANALSAHLGSSVEVTVPGADQTYSAQQATFVLKDFFTKYPVKSYTVVHKGSSGATWYATGSYTSSAGTFDTNIFVKKATDKFQVTQIRFEAE